MFFGGQSPPPPPTPSCVMLMHLQKRKMIKVNLIKINCLCPKQTYLMTQIFENNVKCYEQAKTNHDLDIFIALIYSATEVLLATFQETTKGHVNLVKGHFHPVEPKVSSAFFNVSSAIPRWASSTHSFLKLCFTALKQQVCVHFSHMYVISC